MGKQAVVSGFSLFQHGVLIIVVVDVAALAIAVADAEAGGVVVVMAEDEAGAWGAPGGLHELVEGVVGEVCFLILSCQRAVDPRDRGSVLIIKLKYVERVFGVGDVLDEVVAVRLIVTMYSGFREYLAHKNLIGPPVVI